MKTLAIKTNALGILATVILAILAFLLSKFIGINEVLLALLIGIIIGNLVKLPSKLNPGISLSANTNLELAIVVLAFGINYSNFINLGWQTITIVVSTIAVVLFATLFLAKKLNCPGSTGWLIGFGTAICGSSAIAALAPSVSKDKSDIGIALAVVNLFGLIGMIAIPFITTNWLSDTQNSVLIGTSLHSVGNVAGAAAAVNDAVAEMAITVKLGRVALLTPALLIFGYFLPKETNETQKFSLPWYLVAFIIISIVVSFMPLSPDLKSYAKFASNFLLATAMAAIGLKVSVKTLLSSGKKGMVFGAVVFGIQLAVITLLMYLL